MPLRRVPGTDLQYHLIAFDENGVERREPDGSLQSDAVKQRLADRSEPITDVFFVSHGWKGDVPAAIEQNDRWIAAMAGVTEDRKAAHDRPGGLRSLIVGLHWPSLPWGDESLDDAGAAVLSAADDANVDANVDAYAKRIADTPAARQAIQTILRNADSDAVARSLSATTRAAYATLFAESNLGVGDAASAPGADQPAFEPQDIVQDFAATHDAHPAAGAQVLGDSGSWRDAILSPLRQVSFWKMKDRARAFGESGAHDLLAALQALAPDARFHLMGHSFGCIVVSATVAGRAGAPLLPRPVDSLFLVQGALSLWSYASDIKFDIDKPGYFNRIAKAQLVRGPIVTTRSRFDTAVGRFYPLGARAAQQTELEDDKELPQYGGMGTFGIQGVAGAVDQPMRTVDYRYLFKPGAIYNLEASDVIRVGDGASGAHSDIAHPEVAHAFWSAILASDTDQFLGGVLESASANIASIEKDVASDWVLSAPAAAAGDDVFRGGGGLTREEPPAPPAPSPAHATRAAPPPPPPPAAAAPSPAMVPSPSPAPAEQRYINAEIEDHDRNQPLAKGQWYTLAFDVDVVQRAQAIAAPTLMGDNLFAAGEEVITLTIQLDSADFDVSEPTRQLRVPRHGRSQGKARFDVSPRHDGRSVLKATVHKAGNFVQQIELAFDVGAAAAADVQSTTTGRSVGAANVLQPRDIGVSITPGVGAYECVVWGPVAARARLTLQPAELASAIDALREQLLGVVMYRNGRGEYTFQQSVDIPPADRDAALRIMARAGALLFNQLFFGPAAADDSKRVGTFLKSAASDRTKQLKLQVLGLSTPVPWSLLYLGDASAGAQLDWDNFIGMRHVVEQIPLQTQMSVVDSTIASDPNLSISVNVNSTIDTQMRADFVARQTAFWSTAKADRRRLRVTDRTKVSELTAALANAATTDQILYLYCHAKAAGLTDPRGPASSSLVLSDGAVTLGDLTLDAPAATQLPGAPLVFVNACESAEMSPAFYDGFVPYFMSKGARGVVGTECKTPALFATEWAKRFFERFLDGAALGDTFLALRREFLEQHNNPLGLLYAVHCDGDTQIQPKC